MHPTKKRPIKSQKTDVALKGEIVVAPDKSISHRALIFASLAHGRSKIHNLLEGEDVLKTAAALRLMGAEIISGAAVTAGRGLPTSTETFMPKDQSKTGMNVSDVVGRPRPAQEISQEKDFWTVNGCGVVGLTEPQDVLDMGNSGTAARLLAGLVASYNFTSFFTGDASLRKRPMNRVFEPIKQFGAKIVSRQNGLMPFAITGAENSLPISYAMKMASAQVKSCILLAALGVRGTTTIIEPEKCRDHTEIMMRHLGLKITSENHGNGSKISFSGLQEFDAKDFTVPGDISSAAFFIVAALLVKNSRLAIKNVGVNPLRIGVITSLQEMGGKIFLTNQREIGGEKIADIVVEHSNLNGIEVPASRAASMIDEYPILSIAAANAEGITKMNGLAELKVKESNRLLMIAQNLEACGVMARMGDDFLEVQGGIKQPKSAIKITTNMDHRIAMSFLVMGLQLDNGAEIDDASMIATSFPNFEKICTSLGLGLQEVEGGVR